MQIRGTASIQPTREVTQVDGSQGAQRTESARLDTTDQIELSSEAQQIGPANDTSGVRAERVAELRQQIEAGEYETAAKLDVAVDRLLDELA